MPHTARKRKALDRAAATEGDLPKPSVAVLKTDAEPVEDRGRRSNSKRRKAVQAEQDSKIGSEKDSTSAKMGSKKSATAHSVAIAGFHTLLKRIAQCQDPREKERLRQQMDETYGGLDGYQKESLKGRDRHNAGETGKWLVQQVGPIWKAEQEASGKRRIRLLDVGSLSGTAYHKYKWIDPVNIDLSPQSERVIKSDFFDWPLPQNEAACFDCVALSLVINFEGNLFRRGNMLLHAHKHLTKAGFLFLVLPLACVENSRYLDHARLRAILHACGWNVVEQNDSAKLTRWLCQRRQDQAQAGWDGTSFKKEEIRKGPSFNNFCIRVGQQGREEKT